MITHASLFSGIGAADLAAEELGWRNVFNCEINEFCRRVLDYHFPDADKYKDIYKVNFRKYEGTINVLSGGFPCQSFSVAGRRRGTEDDRYLWPQMFRAITEIKPNYILGENVGGILTMVSPIDDVEVGSEADLFGESHTIHEEHGRFVADIIRADLEREGYTLQIFVIPACAIGAPHRRDRVWFLAKRTTTDPKSQQGNRCESCQPKDCRPGQRQLGGGDCKVCDDWERSIADTTTRHHPEDTMRDGCEQRHSQVEEHQRHIGNVGAGDIQRVCGESERIENADGICGTRWRGFPTTEPVIRRGDDGISERMDSSTISFARWRRESIKAYGNSMVMPLVKEIFKAIQKDIEHDREIR